MEINCHYLFPTTVAEFDLNRNFTEEETYIFTKDYEMISTAEHREDINSSAALTNDWRILDKPQMKDIKKFVESSIQKYISDVMGYDSNRKFDIKITGSWLSKSYSNQSHVRHLHTNSILSGVLYFSVEEDGALVFHKENQIIPSSYSLNEPVEYNMSNSRNWYVPVNVKKLILFPSTLVHSIFNSKNTTEKRICLAFNTFFTGKITDNPSSQVYIEDARFEK